MTEFGTTNRNRHRSHEVMSLDFDGCFDLRVSTRSLGPSGRVTDSNPGLLGLVHKSILLAKTIGMLYKPCRLVRPCNYFKFLIKYLMHHCG